jgi:PAS domain S-box-containing protein
MTLSTRPSPPACPEIPGYSIVEQLYLGSRTAVYRAIQTTQNNPVVIKLLRREYPSFGELVQFRNQYAITKNLPIPGIVHPLSLETLGSGYALVMEDWGGMALNKYLQQQSLTLTDVLAIALQLADILHDLGQHRVVHKDIKPANILIQPESKQVKLIDFSIASLLPKETQEIQSANILEGTLAYLAPEQTGRMNRGIDYRTDFYALGVTLYQLLTGKLPFESNDPFELMHCHIAKMPLSVDRVNPDIPRMVAAIVSKLMAKNAEDRYQSAMGLKHDLAQCLTQWESIGKISEFELGLRDLSDRFLIPEKLYGREQEVQTLLQAFDRVASGSSELMLVAGFSGIGQTAVVNEVHKPIARQRGYFIKGKFDQFNRNIPLSAFVQALRDLMGQLLSECDAQLAGWQAKILTAVGENGQVLIDVLPELEQIIGKQAIAPELSGTAAQNRFNLLFQKFIEVFTTAEHPLVLFLDDLQWADLASLQLLKLLMNDNGYLLLLGAYRDNEVSPIHPFIMTVAELQKAQNIINTITLKPLAFEDTNHLIADTLNCSRELAQPLTELITRKTQGNPFFTTQFLKALHDDGYINFNSDRRYWECDIAQVNALALTDDVVEFMALQLQKLSAKTQQMLKLAACIGNQFDLATLAIVSEQSSVDAATALWKALQEGLILPTSQIYKFFQGTESSDTQNEVNPKYRFLHDRVQQAAYSLIPENERVSAHYQIGQLLLQQISPAAREERIFELVNQLNFGISLITNQTERDNLVEINLTACRKARAATAYKSAHDYAAIGLQLLGKNSWQRQYELTLDLHEIAAEVAWLCGEFERMNQWIEAVLQATQTPLEQVNVYKIKIQALGSQNDLSGAIATAKFVLDILGVHLPDSPTPADIQQEIQEITVLMGERSIEELFHLPKMADAQQIAIQQIAASIVPVCYLTHSPLFPLIVTLQVKRSILFGNGTASSNSYAAYGVLLIMMLQAVEFSDQFGRLAYRLAQEPEAKGIRANTLAPIGMLIHHRKSHLRETLPILREGYQVGVEMGVLIDAGYNAHIWCFNALWCGQPLTELAPQIKAYQQQLLDFNQITTSSYCAIYWETTLLLLDPPGYQALSTRQEELISQKLVAQDLLWVYKFYLHQFTVNFLLGNIAQANQQAVQAKDYLQAGVSSIGEAVFYFYDSLTALATIPEPNSEVEAQQQRVQANQTQLQFWADHAPMNHLHKWQLVEAERYRVLGNKLEAIELYDRAISGAKANGYIQEAALANELAAKFYLNWDKGKIAQEYLTNAYYGYAHWGATAKVQDLESRYPQLLAPILQQRQIALSATKTLFATISLTTFQADGTQSSSSSISATLDLATILKASQTLSSEIELDKLLATLLHTVLENAGADKGVLLMPHDHQWFVEAIATIDHPAQIKSIALADSPELPHSLINNVKRSREPVVIVNAAVHPTLAIDRYVVAQQPKSLLCTPILNQGKLVAILYLENHVTVGAFTRDRVELLNFLCAQAAISLENARLYSQSQKSQRQLTQLLNNLTGIAYSCANDQNWTMKFISGGCLKLTGYPIEDFINNHSISFAKIIYPDDVEMVDAIIQEAVKNHQPYQLTYRLQTRQGEQKWVSEQGQGVFDQVGNLLSLEGFITDISDRKRAETALSESETKFRRLVEDANDVIWSSHLDATLTYLSPQFREVFGWEPEEWIGQSFVPLVHPEDLPSLLEFINRVVESGEKRAGQEFRNSRKDGGFRWLTSNISPIKDESGRVIGLQGILRDISDRKAAEAKLHDSELFLRSTYEGVSQGICVLDVTPSSDFSFVGWNPLIEKLTGIPSTDIVGKNPEELLGDSYGAIVRQNYERCLEAGTTISYEELLPFQGRDIWWLTTLNPLKDEMGCIYRIIITTIKISDRKAAEALIQQKNEALEQALIQVQHSQAQVVQSEKMSALGNLVAGVAHEINNPIGFLKGSINNAKDYVQDLLDYVALYQQHHPNAATPVQDKAEDIDLEFLSEDLPKMLDSMQSASDRIKGISTSLRIFSRADSDHKVSANLHDGIDSTLLILKYRLKANEYRPAIEVIQDYGDLPLIYCFPGQLNQVFMNILANAIDMFDELAQHQSFAELKAHPQQITIRTTADSNQVQIQICDNGKGMTEDVRARIFDHLFTTKSVGKGTGLGLAIARQIVEEKHGGSLEVQSILEEGTEFCIHLPTQEKNTKDTKV